MPSPARLPIMVTVALAAGFVLFRAALFAVTTGTEYQLYLDHGSAARTDTIAGLYESRDVEYPQLATAFEAVVGALADRLPDAPARLVAWRPNKQEERYLAGPPAEQLRGDRYEAALGLVLFAVDLACLLLVHQIARRAYPAEGPARRTGRLVAYALFTGACGLILFDRQDLVVALFACWPCGRSRPAGRYTAFLTSSRI